MTMERINFDATTDNGCGGSWQIGGEKPLDKPLSMRQIVAMSKADEHGYIEGIIRMDISDLIDNDLEGVLDIMSERLTGGGVLSDIAYTVIGHEDNELFIKVCGDADSVIENDGFPWNLDKDDEVTVDGKTFQIGDTEFPSDEVIRIRPKDSGQFIEVKPDDIH
jgi:hypothetical protein